MWTTISKVIIYKFCFYIKTEVPPTEIMPCAMVINPQTKNMNTKIVIFIVICFK